MLSKDDYELLTKIQSDDPRLYKLFFNMVLSYSNSFSLFAHEFRNLVTLINSNCQLIQFQNPDVLSIDTWDTLQSDISNMSVMLSEVSRLCDAIKLETEALDGYTFFKNLCTDFCDTFNTNHNLLTTYISKQITTCTFDPVKIWQAFYYVLNYIFSHTSNEIVVSLKIILHNNHIKITIIDNNINYAKNSSDNLFIPTFNTSTPSNLRTPLCIAKKIILAHNGSITHKNRNNIGNEFVVKLPTTLDENIKNQTSSQAFLMF